MRPAVKLAAIVALAAPGPAALAAASYADARAELVAAFQAGDYGTMVAAAGRALEARPGYPAARFNLALAHALHGDAAAALDDLLILAAANIDFGAGDMAEFEAVRQLDGWEAYRRTMERTRAPVGEARVAARLDDGHFVPEGIAVDDDGTVYLGSIRRGLVVRVGEQPEVLSDRQGHWSVFGMRLDGTGGLWFASAAVEQFEDAGDDLGKTGLFRLDVESGEITRAAVLPQRAEHQVLGDLVIAGNRLYTTDSLTGALYRYDIDTASFATVLEPGTFGSPQGLALDASGQYLFVADYIGGLFRVALADGQREEIRMTDAASAYGIDGLYRDGDRLIAIQNGIRPHRIVSMRLGGDGLEAGDTRILAANLPDFDEPTLGAIRGDRFYFVANSHWNRFGPDNSLPDGLSGPIVLDMRLR